MCEEWLLLAELCPDAEGYETATVAHLMSRVQEAVAQCGVSDDTARVRLVMGDGHTLLRVETCSEMVRDRFLASDTPPMLNPD